SSFKRSESNLALIGKSDSISETRFAPANNSDKIRPTQRLLNISMAFSKRGHRWLIVLTPIKCAAIYIYRAEGGYQSVKCYNATLMTVYLQKVTYIYHSTTYEACKLDGKSLRN